MQFIRAEILELYKLVCAIRACVYVYKPLKTSVSLSAFQIFLINLAHDLQRFEVDLAIQVQMAVTLAMKNNKGFRYCQSSRNGCTHVVCCCSHVVGVITEVDSTQVYPGHTP